MDWVPAAITGAVAIVAGWLGHWSAMQQFDRQADREDARRWDSERFDAYAAILETTYALVAAFERMVPFWKRSEQIPNELQDEYVAQDRALGMRAAKARLVGSEEIGKALDAVLSGAITLGSMPALPFDDPEQGNYTQVIEQIGEDLMALMPVAQGELGMRSGETPSS